MGEQKNIPILRFPGFEGEWRAVKLGDVAELTSSKRVYLSDYVTQGIPFFRGKEITELKQNKIPQEVLYISQDAYEGFKEMFGVPQINDILITAVGTLGSVLRVRTNKPFYFKDGNLIWLRRINQDSCFLEFLLSKKQKDIEKSAIGSSQKALTMVELRKISFCFPTIPEQQKIASFFTTIDQKISQLKQKHQLLEQYKKGVMQKIFNQEIRFKDDNGREFPKWEKKRLGEILYEHKTLNSKGDFQEVFSVAKHKGVVNQIEHLGRSFSAKDVSNYKVIYPNDIVYTKSPTSDFPFGIIKQNLTSRTGIVSPLYGVFRPANAYLGFLFHNYFLSWVNTYNYLNPLVQKGAKNTMNINNKDFLNGAKISLPIAEKEQTKIANFLSAIDDKIQHTQNQIEQVERWKKGLMQRMFC